MAPFVVLDRSNKHFSRFIDLLREREHVRVKDMKKLVSHSSYYGMILKKVCSLNELMRELCPKFYIAEPAFDVTESKEVFTALKRCPNLVIEARKEFFLLRYTP
jgi:hypothetical protein